MVRPLGVWHLQPIFLHCFTGIVELVQPWTEKSNKIYFGYTAAVQNINKDQLQGLKCIPSDRILLETDSPYRSPKVKGYNTQAYIGDVALWPVTETPLQQYYLPDFQEWLLSIWTMILLLSVHSLNGEECCKRILYLYQDRDPNNRNFSRANFN